MTQTRSANRLASTRSCVTNSTVAPVRSKTSLRSRCKPARISGSRAPNGSSNKQNPRVQEQGPHQAQPLALPAGQLVRDSGVNAASGNWVISTNSARRSLNALFRDQPSCRAMSVTFSTPVRCGKQSAFLNHISQLAPDGTRSSGRIKRNRVDRDLPACREKPVRPPSAKSSSCRSRWGPAARRLRPPSMKDRADGRRSFRRTISRLREIKHGGFRKPACGRGDSAPQTPLAIVLRRGPNG